MKHEIPSSMSVLKTLVGVTLLRVGRGKALWVCVFIGLLPLILAFGLRTRPEVAEVTLLVELFMMAILPPIFIASSIGEEIEDRTTTYLWSRPLPRWTVLVGKLLALAPIAMLLIAGGWIAAILLGTGGLPDARSTIAFAAGGLAVATMAAGIATLVPRHGMALSIIYIVIVDIAIGAIPASLQSISITRQTRLLSGLSDESAFLEPVIAMILIPGLWLFIGLRRLRKLES